MVYVYIENKEVMKVGDLPRNTSRVSNFNLLNESEQIKHGWHKLIEDNTQLQSWQKIENISYLFDGIEESYKEVIPKRDLIEYVDSLDPDTGETVTKTIRTPQDPEIITHTYFNGTVTEVKNIVDMDLDEWKSFNKLDIKLNYNGIMKEGFTSTSGIKVDCRESDKVNWLGVKIESENLGLTEVSIRDYNNVTQVISKADFDTLYYELYAHYDSMLKKKWDLQTQIDNATTHEEVAAIQWQ